MMQDIKFKLESIYCRIEQERMKDVPFCNSALNVQAVGFRKWQNYYFGVMVTPWFMNLMLLPVETQDEDDLQEGSKQTHVFPSGSYEFIVGKEADLGSYLACSLFSPMYDFDSQQAVIETARQVLKGIMEETNQETISMHEKTIRKIWQQDENTEPGIEETMPGDNNNRLSLEEKMETPVSRRDFLRFSMRDEERERGNRG